MTEETKQENVEPANQKRQVIITTRIKDILHEGNIRSSEDFIEAVNDKVIEMCRTVIVRCKSNNRSTAKICDL